MSSNTLPENATDNSQNKTDQKTILLIEDDSVLAQMYSRKLESVGYKVLHASDGEEGLNFALKNNVDLILTDIMMPKVSGTDFIEKLKKNRKKASIPIIAWSNLAQSAEKERALSMGVKEYLVKNETSLEEVAEKVKKYLL